MKLYNFDEFVNESTSNDWKVVWTDRDYKEHSKVFKNKKAGAPDNARIAAEKFLKSLEKKDKKDPHGLYRSLEVRPVNEGKNWNKLMKGVRSSESGPWSIIAIKGGKVVDQKISIKDPNIIPAHWEEFKKKNSGAKFRVEDGTGRIVYSEE